MIVTVSERGLLYRGRSGSNCSPFRYHRQDATGGEIVVCAARSQQDIIGGDWVGEIGSQQDIYHWWRLGRRDWLRVDRERVVQKATWLHG